MTVSESKRTLEESRQMMRRAFVGLSDDRAQAAIEQDIANAEFAMDEAIDELERREAYK